MNKVVHFEIPADDTKRAQKFYSEVFGWQINEIPEMNYTVVRTVECDENNMPKEKGAINGGIMKRDVTTGGEAPVVVIKVDNLDEHLKKIEAAGGTIAMQEVNVGEMGLYARVQDTEGNVIGVWQDLPRNVE